MHKAGTECQDCCSELKDFSSTKASDFCRLSSQDSSYLVVHEGAPTGIYNNLPVQLTKASGTMMSRLLRRWPGNNVAVTGSSDSRCWIEYDPSSREPDDIGLSVFAAVITVSCSLVAA